jgi:hypothetical protein
MARYIYNQVKRFRRMRADAGRGEDSYHSARRFYIAEDIHFIRRIHGWGFSTHAYIERYAILSMGIRKLFHG